MENLEPEIFHDISLGVDRLLSAPQDLPAAMKIEGNYLIDERLSGKHQLLFTQYVQMLSEAVKKAVSWWNSLVEIRMRRGETKEEAIRENYRLRPAGPASYPEIVWVVRKFWLECDQLNRLASPDQRIPPEMFLLKLLQSKESEKLIAVLSGMPYWPIGLDKEGNWV